MYQLENWSWKKQLSELPVVTSLLSPYPRERIEIISNNKSKCVAYHHFDHELGACAYVFEFSGNHQECLKLYKSVYKELGDHDLLELGNQPNTIRVYWRSNFTGTPRSFLERITKQEHFDWACESTGLNLQEEQILCEILAKCEIDSGNNEINPITLELNIPVVLPDETKKLIKKAVLIISSRLILSNLKNIAD